MRRILDARQTLEHRFPQIACDGKRNQTGEHNQSPDKTRVLKDEVCEDILLVAEPPRQDEENDDDHVGADCTFPGLVGRNRRTHLMLAPGAAAEISADVCSPHDKED